MIRAGHLGLAMLLAGTLSGCIAAAIPVLAGGAIAGSSVRGGGEKAPARAEKSSVPRPEASRAAVTPNPIAPNPRAIAAETSVATVAPAPVGPTPYDAFIAFALAEARPYLPNETRRSTVLANPDALSPETRPCHTQPPAVMIDLDPQGDVLDPEAVDRIAVELAPALSRLRAKGLTIVWLSGAERSRSEAIRHLLARTMLDPSGRDVLALPAPSERKQGLRRRLGKEFCVEAIAGDRRADFDELYDFLRDENTALALEPLIGKGWFLVPPVLAKED